MTDNQQTSDEDEIQLSVLEQDIKSQMRRLKSMLGGEGVSSETVLTELLHTVFPFMLDHLKLTDRLEEHAEWAGEQIDYLVSDQTPPSSQLLAEDADRFRMFIDKVVALCNATLSELPLGEETRSKRADLQAIAESGTELRSLVDELRVDADDDDRSADDVASDTINSAVKTLPDSSGDGIVNLPSPDGSS